MQELLQLPEKPTSEQLLVIEEYLKLQKKERKKNNYGKQNYYEDRHRGWITKMMTGDATSEEYNAAIPPHPDPYHPEDDEE